MSVLHHESTDFTISKTADDVLGQPVDPLGAILGRLGAILGVLGAISGDIMKCLIFDNNSMD